jgi:hypothetical protein
MYMRLLILLLVGGGLGATRGGSFAVVDRIVSNNLRMLPDHNTLQKGDSAIIQVTTDFVKFFVALAQALLLPRTPPTIPAAPSTTARPSTDALLEEMRRELVQRVRPQVRRLMEPFVVTRANAFGSALEALSGPIAPLREQELRIEFLGETGIGVGAVRDWLSEVAIQITGSLFAKSDDGFVSIRSEPPPTPPPSRPLRSFLPFMRRRRQSAREFDQFRAIGRLLGLCFLNGHQLPVKFSNLLFAKLLSEPLTMDLIKDENPDLYTSLFALLKINNPQDLRWIEISIDNVDHQVTLSNRGDLIERKLNSMVGPDHLFERIRSGFNEVMPIFRIRESPIDSQKLALLLVGTTRLDVDDLFRFLKVRGETDEGHLELLRKALSRMIPEDQQLFLRFVRGSPNIPPGGFEKNPITVVLLPRSNALPTASTCATTLRLPKYASEQILTEKLLIAVRENQGLAC